LKISIKNQGKCEKVLTIQVPSERVRGEYDKYYAEASKTARIPGFRPGRAPKEVVAMHFSGEARKAVLKQLIQETTFEALKSEKIEPLYYPTIGRIDFEGEKLSFDATVELRPEVKLGSYKGLKVQKKEVKLEESAVEEALTHIRESYSKFIPVEDRPAEIGDFLACDLDCEVEGKKIESRKDDFLELNPPKMQAELAQGLVGLKPGETRTIEVNFPKDFGVKDYAGKRAQFTVQAKEIKKRELPQLTDEWVQGLGEFKTVEEFKKRVREDLAKQKENEADNQFENEMFEALLKNAKVEVPEGAVARRVKSLVETAQKHSQAPALPAEEAAKRTQELEEKFRPEAERQIKLSFILEEVAKLEKLNADEKDLEVRFQELAGRAKISVEKVRQYYNQSEEKQENLLHQITHEKVLKFLKDNVK
jgi:trigger factor